MLVAAAHERKTRQGCLIFAIGISSSVYGDQKLGKFSVQQTTVFFP